MLGLSSRCLMIIYMSCTDYNSCNVPSCSTSSRHMDAAHLVVRHAAEALAVMPGPQLESPTFGTTVAATLNKMALPTGIQDLIVAMGGTQWAATVFTEIMVTAYLNI